VSAKQVAVKLVAYNGEKTNMVTFNFNIVCNNAGLSCGQSFKLFISVKLFVKLLIIPFNKNYLAKKLFSNYP
jgi:hypothetical protein